MYERILVGVMVAAALIVGHRVARSSAPVPRERAAACRLRLGGAIEGEYPCSASLEQRTAGVAISLATPPGARAQISLDVVLAERRGALEAAEGTEARAMVREPGHAGVGMVWTRPGGVSGAVREGGTDRHVDLRVEVGPGRANPDARPVVLEASLALPSAGAVASRR
jgi:hypothetical protein